MGVLPTPRKIKIPTGDSNSEASSAPQTGHYILLSALPTVYLYFYVLWKIKVSRNYHLNAALVVMGL